MRSCTCLRLADGACSSCWRSSRCLVRGGRRLPPARPGVPVWSLLGASAGCSWTRRTGTSQQWGSRSSGIDVVDAAGAFADCRSFRPHSYPQRAAPCLAIVERNAELSVTWVHSYVSEDDRKSFCIYDAPSPEAIRKSAADNALPVERITQIRGSIRTRTAEDLPPRPGTPTPARGAGRSSSGRTSPGTPTRPSQARCCDRAAAGGRERLPRGDARDAARRCRDGAPRHESRARLLSRRVLDRLNPKGTT
jgi:hypothetical protein